MTRARRAALTHASAHALAHALARVRARHAGGKGAMPAVFLKHRRPSWANGGFWFLDPPLDGLSSAEGENVPGPRALLERRAQAVAGRQSQVVDRVDDEALEVQREPPQDRVVGNRPRERRRAATRARARRRLGEVDDHAG